LEEDKHLLLSILYKRVNPSKADESSVVRSDVTMKKILRSMISYYDVLIDKNYKYKKKKRCKKGKISFLTYCDLIVAENFDQDLIKLLGLQNSQAISNSLASLIAPSNLIIEIGDNT
jgi:hypothetical protein